jgi:hypothetical protein
MCTACALTTVFPICVGAQNLLSHIAGESNFIIIRGSCGNGCSSLAVSAFCALRQLCMRKCVHSNVFNKVEEKVKWSRYTPWRHMGERRYSSYSFLISALDGGQLSSSRPGRALPPGKRPPVPIVQEAGWASEPVWTQGLEEKSSAPVGDRSPVVQSVVRHYTDWTTAALYLINYNKV